MVDARTTVGLWPAAPPLRPEYLREIVAADDIGVVQQPLTVWQRLVNHAWLRKIFILVVIAAAWEIYARRLGNPLLVPTFTATLEAFEAGILSGDIPQKVSNSVQLLLKGYAIGLALAMVFTALAMMSRIGNDLLETLTSAFNPLSRCCPSPSSGLGWAISRSYSYWCTPCCGQWRSIPTRDSGRFPTRCAWLDVITDSRASASSPRF